MNRKINPIKTALVPIGLGSEGEQALAVARTIATEVTLVGIVPIAEGQSISAGTQAAREVRLVLPETGVCSAKPAPAPAACCGRGSSNEPVAAESR